MQTRLTHSKWLYLAVVLLFLSLLTSCDVLAAAAHYAGKSIQQSESGKQNITATPPLPDETQNATVSPSGPILERALDAKPVSLIDDRLFIQMPAGAEDFARQQGLMGAERSNHEETRLMLEGNGQKLVVYAQDTFYYAENEQNDIGKILKWRNGESYTYTAEKIRESSNGFKLIKVTPDKIDTSVEAVIIREAVAIIDDGTMIYIGVYVTPQTAVDQELCIKQADRILESIQPGTRKINVSAHDETIGDDFSIKLDPGFVLIEQPGVDFSVYYITKVTKLGEFIPSIGIYIGGHPTLIYPGRGIETEQLKTINDTILFKRVEWLSYIPSSNPEHYSAETVFGLPLSFMRMHIFVDASSEVEFLRIKQMIDTIKYK